MEPAGRDHVHLQASSRRALAAEAVGERAGAHRRGRRLQRGTLPHGQEMIEFPGCGVLQASISNMLASVAEISCSTSEGSGPEPTTEQVVRRNGSCTSCQQEEQDGTPDQVLVPGLWENEKLDGH